MSTSKKRLLAVLATLALASTACGGSDDAGGDDAGGDDGTSSATESGTAADGGGAEPFEAPDEGVYADRIDYGLIYDQTGPTASTQTLFASGILTHIQAINEAGGIHGRTINVLEEDEKYEVPAGVAAYNKLVDQTPVVGMTALNNSSFQGAVIEDIDENGVPIIGAESTTETAVTPFRNEFFSMLCTYADQADVAVAYSTELVGDGERVPRTATIFGNVASGEEYHLDIKERVEHAGGEYVGSVSLEYGSTEADSQAQRIAQMDPEVIHLHGGVSIGAPVLSSLAKFGITDVPVIGIFAMHVNDVPEAAPEVPFYAVNCYSNGYEEVEGSEQLIEEAEAAGYPPEEYERSEFVNGWIVAHVIERALEAAGPELTRERLGEAVESIQDFQIGDLSPPITFGPDDHIGNQAVRPFRFDPETGRYEGVGQFTDWANCVSNEYLNQGLGDWSPVGCFSG